MQVYKQQIERLKEKVNKLTEPEIGVEIINYVINSFVYDELLKYCGPGESPSC